MKKIVLFLLLLVFVCCSKVEDDTLDICNSNCTILKGKVITMNEVGVPGVEVNFQYRFASSGFSDRRRKIASIKTDENGEFYKEFYIEDQELGDSTNGFFELEIDNSKLDVTRYILSDNLIGTTTIPLKSVISRINRRDTVISKTYYLPKKNHIKVNLNNFILQNDNHFEVRSYYPFGAYIGSNDFLDTAYGDGFSGFGTYTADKLDNLFSVYVAENEKNIIRIFKRKDGISTIEDYEIFIPSNNTIELTYEY